MPSVPMEPRSRHKMRPESMTNGTTDPRIKRPMRSEAIGSKPVQWKYWISSVLMITPTDPNVSAITCKYNPSIL